MSKMHVKRDDTVIVVSGDDKGKKGKVIATSPKEGKVLVSECNIVSKHVKPKKQGEAGGIMKVEAAMYASKVQLFCSKCDKATRAKQVIVDGEKIRSCVKCGTKI